MPDHRVPIMRAMEHFCDQYPDLRLSLDYKAEADKIIDEAPRPSAAVEQITQLVMKLKTLQPESGIWSDRIRLAGFKARLDSFFDL